MKLPKARKKKQTNEDILSIIQERDKDRYEELLKLKEEDPEKFEIEIEGEIEGEKEANKKEKTKNQYEDKLSPIEEISKEKNIELEDLKDLADMADKNKICYLSNEYDMEYNLKLIEAISTIKDKLIFIINKNKRLKGKIINKLFEYQKEFPLCVKAIKFSGGKEINKIFLINEIFSPYKWKIEKKVECEFFIYQFLSNNREYILFSEDELDFQEYDIEGMILKIVDNILIGSSSKIGSKLPMLFVNKAKSKIIKYKSYKKLIEACKKLKLTDDKFKSFLFSRKNGYSYRHPAYFENLILAFLFSAPYGDDPFNLHLLIIAIEGTGKSFIIEELHNKLNEDEPIIEGSASTIKSLIPSFKGNIPKAGAFIKSNRICPVDEFLKLLVRVKAEEREEQLSFLNSLLEMKERSYASGNCSMKAKATAKFMGVTNAIFGTKSFPALRERIEGSFLSRLLIFYQDKEHIKFIQKGEGKEKTKFKMDKNDFISIFDYFQTFRAKYDEEKIINIFELFKGFLPSDIKNIYTARYKHHINCLIDGLIKARCIFEGDESFEAKSKDYDKLLDIWRRMIVNWDCNEDIKKLSLKEKWKYLTEAQQYIIELIKKEGGQIHEGKKELKEINNLFSELNALEDLEIIAYSNHYYILNEDIDEVVK